MAIRHKRDADARRTSTRSPRRPSRALLVAAPLAVAATATAVTVGVATQPAETVAAQDVSSGLSASISHDADLSDLYAARKIVSRSSSRVDAGMSDARMQRAYDASLSRTATSEAVRTADRHLWTTTALNLWTGPGKRAHKTGLLEKRSRVLVTGRRSGDRAEVVVAHHSRWVTAAYLVADKPEKEHPADTGSTDAEATDTGTTEARTTGLSTAPCPDTSVESGLTSEAVSVYRAVCHAFPQVTSYGGWDAHGEHTSGRAIDIMTSGLPNGRALGDQIAAFLQSHASELDLYDVIWWDRIWTPARASEGWRAYGDHGSPTANHMDHVHVATNG